MEKKMKVFLSWSGSLSHSVACLFRDWLPNILQYVDPYVSSEDIDKGARWSSDIAKELEQSFFGILIVTKDNHEAPWITFEAGALSKMLEKSRVSPFLFNLKRSDLQGPLLQFQSTINDKDDILKLVISINKNSGEDHKLEDERLKKIFEVWWPELNLGLEKISRTLSVGTNKESSEKKGVSEILEELLDLARIQQRILSSPQELLPPDYFNYIFDHLSSPRIFSGVTQEEIMNRINSLDNLFDEQMDLIMVLITKNRTNLEKTEIDQFRDNILKSRDHLQTIANIVAGKRIRIQNRLLKL